MLHHYILFVITAKITNDADPITHHFFQQYRVFVKKCDFIISSEII
jgi:hypothetical protein